MRSIVIVLSITIGLFAGISVLALYKGMMKGRVRTVIDAEVSHLQIHDINFKKDYEPWFIIENGANILSSVRLIPEVKLAVPRTITTGMLSTVTGSTGIQINGVVPELEYKVSQLKRKIISGRGFDTTKTNEIIVGQKLANKMKLKVRSKLVLTFTDTASNIVSGAFRVAAIYKSENSALDERNVYVEMRDLNALLTIDLGFHEIAILLKNDADLPAVQKKLQQEFPF